MICKGKRHGRHVLIDTTARSFVLVPANLDYRLQGGNIEYAILGTERWTPKWQPLGSDAYSLEADFCFFGGPQRDGRDLGSR
jgi:hypothetical protein